MKYEIEDLLIRDFSIELFLNEHTKGSDCLDKQVETKIGIVIDVCLYSGVWDKVGALDNL